MTTRRCDLSKKDMKPGHNSLEYTYKIYFQRQLGIAQKRGVFVQSVLFLSSSVSSVNGMLHRVQSWSGSHPWPNFKLESSVDSCELSIWVGKLLRGGEILGIYVVSKRMACKPKSLKGGEEIWGCVHFTYLWRTTSAFPYLAFSGVWGLQTSY